MFGILQFIQKTFSRVSLSIFINTLTFEVKTGNITLILSKENFRYLTFTKTNITFHILIQMAPIVAVARCNGGECSTHKDIYNVSIRSSFPFFSCYTTHRDSDQISRLCYSSGEFVDFPGDAKKYKTKYQIYNHILHFKVGDKIFDDYAKKIVIHEKGFAFYLPDATDEYNFFEKFYFPLAKLIHEEPKTLIYAEHPSNPFFMQLFPTVRPLNAKENKCFKEFYFSRRQLESPCTLR